MKEFYESYLSHVELAKRLKVIKGITTRDSDFQEIKGKFVNKDDLDRIDGIIHGLSQEDEFAILCKMMERCSILTSLDQTPIINSDIKTADFLASFNPSAVILNVPPCLEVSFNCMVEVKSTKEKNLKITRKDLERRINYASKFNLPLIYAVRFTMAHNHALWVLVDANEVKEKYRIEVNHYVKGIGSVLLDNYSVIINSSYAVIQIYTKNQTKNTIFKNEYGSLYKILIADESGIKFVAENSDCFLINLLIGIYGAEESFVESANENTLIYSYFDVKRPVFLIDILYSTLNMAINESGEKDYDPIRYMSHMDSQNRKTVVPTRSLFEDLFQRVNQSCDNFFLYGLLDGVEETKEKLLRFVNSNNIKD